MGCCPKIFLDFLQAPSPSIESIAAFPQPLKDLATRLTRSWGDNEQGYLAKMPLLGEAIVVTQPHSHRSILYMSAIVDKVINLGGVIFLSYHSVCLVVIVFFLPLHQLKVELDKLPEAKDQALGLFERIEEERAQFATKEKEYEDKLNKMGVELDASLSTELRLREEIDTLRVQGDRANMRAEMEKKNAEKERARVEEERATLSRLWKRLRKPT